MKPDVMKPKPGMYCEAIGEMGLIVKVIDDVGGGHYTIRSPEDGGRYKVVDGDKLRVNPPRSWTDLDELVPCQQCGEALELEAVIWVTPGSGSIDTGRVEYGRGRKYTWYCNKCERHRTTSW